jgi:hypothetical protein
MIMIMIETASISRLTLPVYPLYGSLGFLRANVKVKEKNQTCINQAI